MWAFYFNCFIIHRRTTCKIFSEERRKKQWGYPVSYLTNDRLWLGENDKETGDFIMLLSSVIFFLFTIPLWFPSSPAPCQWMFEAKAEMTKIAVQSSVCYSEWKLLNIIGRGLLLVVEEWAGAPTRKYISRKIIVSWEELRSCSTGRGQATNFSFGTGFVLFKVLYVGGQVSRLYVDFGGEIGEIHQY